MDYAAKALTVLPIGRTQTPELLGGNAALALARQATEKGPSLSAAVAAEVPAATSAGFGEGLVGLGAVPAVQELTGLPSAGSMADADVALLKLVQEARRADKGNGSPTDKAAAWEHLAAYAGKNPYKQLAEKRRDEWKQVAEAEAREREQDAKVCAQHAKDSAKLAELLAMDDDVVPSSQKKAYKAEMKRVYAPFSDVVEGCPALERAAAQERAAEQQRAAAQEYAAAAARPTFRQPSTGLVWQKEPADRLMNWDEAMSYCATLSLAGGGWRLPTKDELLALDNAKSSVDAWVPGMYGRVYWSSSSVAGSSGNAWPVNFNYGYSYSHDASNTFSVRCVR